MNNKILVVLLVFVVFVSAYLYFSGEETDISYRVGTRAVGQIWKIVTTPKTITPKKKPTILKRKPRKDKILK